jgi:hypothetical protein
MEIIPDCNEYMRFNEEKYIRGHISPSILHPTLEYFKGKKLSQQETFTVPKNAKQYLKYLTE